MAAFDPVAFEVLIQVFRGFLGILGLAFLVAETAALHSLVLFLLGLGFGTHAGLLLFALDLLFLAELSNRNLLRTFFALFDGLGLVSARHLQALLFLIASERLAASQEVWLPELGCYLLVAFGFFVAALLALFGLLAAVFASPLAELCHLV